jgi:hypothetical protein
VATHEAPARAALLVGAPRLNSGPPWRAFLDLPLRDRRSAPLGHHGILSSPGRLPARLAQRCTTARSRYSIRRCACARRRTRYRPRDTARANREGSALAARRVAGRSEASPHESIRGPSPATRATARRRPRRGGARAGRRREARSRSGRVLELVLVAEPREALDHPRARFTQRWFSASSATRSQQAHRPRGVRVSSRAPSDSSSKSARSSPSGWRTDSSLTSSSPRRASRPGSSNDLP